MQPNRCPVDAASAGDVMAAQERLRGLLRANALVASELSLPVVLRQVVEAAWGLPGARYAALGVLARDGGWNSSYTPAWTMSWSRRLRIACSHGQVRC